MKLITSMIRMTNVEVRMPNTALDQLLPVEPPGEQETDQSHAGHDDPEDLSLIPVYLPGLRLEVHSENAGDEHERQEDHGHDRQTLHYEVELVADVRQISVQ